MKKEIGIPLKERGGRAYINKKKKICSIDKRNRQYFEQQVERYRSSLERSVCHAWDLQSRGLTPPNILHIKRVLRETSRYFQMPDEILINTYQRLKSISDELTTITMQAG